MSERKLATIQQIIDVKPIEGADKVELCFVKGWQVVCKKGEFKVGDHVVYVEVDSQLPEKPEYEFLRPRKFRVRTIKLRKQLSQGLILPESVLTNGIAGHCIDLDVSEELGIVKYDPQAQEEKELSIPKHQNKALRFLMQFKAFRTVYMALNQKENGWPVGVISKTDEENIQNMYNVISENFYRSFYITEKLEGQSATFYTTTEKVWGFNRKVFGVCSRNIRLKADQSKYWQMARKYNLEKVLKSYPRNMAIQAEQCGEGIQGNIYKLTGIDLYVFNVHFNGVRLCREDMLSFCDKHCLKAVPVLDANFIPAEHIPCNDKDSIVKWLLDYSNGTSLLFKTMREGVILRLNENPIVSVKAKSPDYLIKHEE
jgi:hypothetical protein